MTIDLLLGVVIGLVAGVLLTLLFKKLGRGSDSSRVKELEEEHAGYRKQVDDHFVNTAVLFKGLTEQYRDVYRHISSGAGELCSEEAKATKIELEDTMLLVGSAETVAVEKEAALSEPSPETRADDKTDQTAVTDSVEETDEVVASEVEVPAGVAEEIKKQAAKK